MNEVARFQSKIEVGPDCWHWTGGKKAAGYGHFSIKRNGKWGKAIAHRYAYELWVSPIPAGLEIDHLCKTRDCVNPDHLEAVTLQENRIRRDAGRTHCKHGHSLAEVGTYPDGKCRECVRMRRRADYATKRPGPVGPPTGERTHCPQGHAFAGDNLRLVVRADGGTGRRCRECDRAAVRRSYARRRARERW